MTKEKAIYPIKFLGLSVGLVYLWFGVLKFFPALSPAEDLAKQTINALSFGWLPADVSIKLLAIWETLIGLALISNVYRKVTLWITFLHILLTFSPFFLFPEQSFTRLPYGFTLLGQYIFKNIIIIGALIVLLNYSMSEGVTTKRKRH